MDGGYGPGPSHPWSAQLSLLGNDGRWKPSFSRHILYLWSLLGAGYSRVGTKKRLLTKHLRAPEASHPSSSLLSALTCALHAAFLVFARFAVRLLLRVGV